MGNKGKKEITKFKISIKYKCTLYLIITGLLLGGISLASFSSIHKKDIINKTNQIGEDASKILVSFFNEQKIGNKEDLQNFLVSLEKQELNNTTTEYNNTKKVIIQSIPSIKNIKVIAKNDNIEITLPNTYDEDKLENINNVKYILLTNDIFKGDKKNTIFNKGLHNEKDEIIGFIEFTIDIENFYNTVQKEIALIIIIIVIVIFLISLISMIYFEAIVGNPLKELNKKLRIMFYTDYSINKKIFEIEDGNFDEIAEIKQNLHMIEEQMKNYISSLQVTKWENEHDAMTQIYNRRKFNEMIKVYEKKQTISIINFDINDLKKINDTLGHHMGDKLIYMFAESIEELNKEDIHCYRIGGDEFLMVLLNKKEEELYNIIEIWQKNLYDINKKENIICKVSYGEIFAETPFNIDELIKQADEKMYINKKENKDT